MYFPENPGTPAPGKPTLFLEVDLHVMHIYNAFPTTHRIPAAASSGEALVPQSFLSLLLPLALPHFPTSRGKSGEGPKSQHRNSNLSLAPADNRQVTSSLRASVFLLAKSTLLRPAGRSEKTMQEGCWHKVLPWGKPWEVSLSCLSSLSASLGERRDARHLQSACRSPKPLAAWTFVNGK